MDRSQQILSAVDELRQIRKQVRLADSLDSIRNNFERLQTIRRQHIDDFDLQILIADAQQEIIERARALRPGKSLTDEPTGPRTELAPYVDENESVAEIPPEVPKLDRKSWQVAMGLAAVFTVAIFVIIFYLIQSARRINFPDDSSAKLEAPQKPSDGVKTKPVADTAAVSITPTLRLYTDLIPGTVSIDDQPEQTLVDGEFNLDNIKPGDHSVKVAGKSGSAAFTFSVADEKQTPRVSSVPVSNNAMVVLVSVQDGKGRLVTDASGAQILLDTKPAGSVSPAMDVMGSNPKTGLEVESLDLPDLGNVDHNLEVLQARDRQRFVLTYTPAPALTVFVKSDPSTGMLMVVTGQEGVTVFINDLPYRRPTEHGQVRVPLKVGSYRIRVHKDGFLDPPAAPVTVKKSEEASVQFRMQPAPDFATLQIKGAQMGTSVYIDGQFAATTGADGAAEVVNIKSGEHVIELHHDQLVTKQLTRTFTTGATLVLSGADVALDKLAADSKTVIPANPGPPALPPPTVPQLQQAPVQASESVAGTQTIHKGGGFVPYRTPKTAGHYYFQARTHLGGLLKHGKLEWYAGYQDKDNYVLFSVDGKHATVREIRDGKAAELAKIPFEVDSDQWVQVDVALKADSIVARVKTGESSWSELRPVGSSGRDFTKDGVGLYVPANDEVAVANYRFTDR